MIGLCALLFWRAEGKAKDAISHDVLMYSSHLVLTHFNIFVSEDDTEFCTFIKYWVAFLGRN
jgi:hypothetical protein